MKIGRKRGPKLWWPTATRAEVGDLLFAQLAYLPTEDKWSVYTNDFRNTGATYANYEAARLAVVAMFNLEN